MSHFLRRFFAKRKPAKRAATYRPQLEVLEDRFAPAVTLKSGVLNIVGTNNADTIRVVLNGANLDVTLNGVTTPFATASLNSLFISGKNGNDDIQIATDVGFNAQITGGKGNDIILSGAGNDVIRGDDGNDLIVGGGGDDIIDGLAGNDKLDGGAGNDRLGGASGNDILHGGQGNDFLLGGAGNDAMIGSVGNDRLTGGRGADKFVQATADVDDDGDVDVRVDFRETEDVEFAFGLSGSEDLFKSAHLLGVRTDLLPGLLPGAPDVNNNPHTAGDIDYVGLGFTSPPTYGPHHEAEIASGVYETARDDADVVHNLEHGRVWIVYDKDLLSDPDEDEKALIAIVNAFGLQNGIVLSPRSEIRDPVTNNEVAIGLASWAHLLTLNTLDRGLIINFIMTNRAHGPEVFLRP